MQHNISLSEFQQQTKPTPSKSTDISMWEDELVLHAKDGGVGELVGISLHYTPV